MVSGFQSNPRAFDLGIKEIVRLSESILWDGSVPPKPIPVSKVFARGEADGTAHLSTVTETNGGAVLHPQGSGNTKP